MNQKDVNRMAQEAHQSMIASGRGACVWHGDAYVGDVQEFCQRFAALVAAAEREACAKVCEDQMTGINPAGDIVREDCADAIRAREVKSEE